MLRDWQLPVARSQAAFDTWRKAVRNPVWAAIAQQLQKTGIASDLLGGEQMIFQVAINKTELVIAPLHVIDLARSVVLSDPRAGATRVLDAWSLRSAESKAEPKNLQSSQNVSDLVHSAFAKLTEGDRNVAREYLLEAFSLDPGAAFRGLELNWLGLFPDTRQRMLEMQHGVKPVIEAAEWQEAFEQLQTSPAYKDDFREYVTAFRDMLESYPKAPVDLHIRLALPIRNLLSMHGT
jgi:hypothetical protein